MSDGAKLRPQARGHDQATRGPASRVGSEEDAVQSVAQARRGGDGARSLFDGKALAGQHGFADEEVSGLENHAVGRNQAARGEQHDVARHDLFQGHIDRTPVAKDTGLCPHARLKGRRGGLCLVLARVSNAHRGEHDHDDDDGIDPLARQRRCRGGEDQHQQQRVAELIHQYPRPREALVLAHLVRPVLRAAVPQLLRQTDRRVLSQVAAPACRRQHSSSPSADLPASRQRRCQP